MAPKRRGGGGKKRRQAAEANGTGVDEGEAGGSGPRPKTGLEIAIRVAVIVIASGILILRPMLFPSVVSEEALAVGQVVEVPCAPSDREVVRGCSPSFCGRVVNDNVVTPLEAEMLIEMAETAMRVSGGSSGGATIVDPHSGGVSKGERFVDVFDLFARINAAAAAAAAASDATSEAVVLGGRGGGDRVGFTSAQLDLLADVRDRLEMIVKDSFGLRHVHLSSPTFFSRMKGGVASKTLHDEYWHVHVDTIAYESFDYTGLLYLNDHGDDFDGGAFAFVDASFSEGRAPATTTGNWTVSPKAGRFLAFTSSAENPHQVRRVDGGTRYALTISFTCDRGAAVTDFLSRARAVANAT